jgi:hypothetical protein
MSICLLGSAINWTGEKSENGLWKGFATVLQPLDITKLPAKIQVVGGTGDIKEFQLWNSSNNWAAYMSGCQKIMIEFRYEQWPNRTVPPNSIAFPENS